MSTPRYPDVTVPLAERDPWHRIVVDVRRAIRARHRDVPRATLNEFTLEVLEAMSDDVLEVADRWVVVVKT